jgi:hypothetical protein
MFTTFFYRFKNISSIFLNKVNLRKLRYLSKLYMISINLIKNNKLKGIIDGSDHEDYSLIPNPPSCDFSSVP